MCILPVSYSDVFLTVATLWLARLLAMSKGKRNSLQHPQANNRGYSLEH